MKKITTGLLVISGLVLAGFASAHAVVSPSTATTSQRVNFALSVPSEKDAPTVEVRLLVPDTLGSVTPFVKPGWTISTTKNADGKVTEIKWSGGNIPSGQKDLFQFTAATPASAGRLVWKAYQTYQNGQIVSWDQDPNVQATGQTVTPYSTTEVKADSPESNTESGNKPGNTSLVLSIVALALSVVALARKSRV